MEPSRRRMLTAGLAGTAALALGGLGLALQPGVRQTPDAPLKSLTLRQYSVLVALTEVVVPGGEGLPSGVALGVPADVDHLLSTTPPGLDSELGAALLLLENGLAGALLDGRLRPFSALDVSERTALWTAWASSDTELQRTVFKGLNTLITAAYWAHPELWEHVGYNGPPEVTL